MDPTGCLAAASPGSFAPLPASGTFTAATAALLCLTACAAGATRAANAGAPPPPGSGAASSPAFGFPGARTVALLCKLVWAISMPPLAAFLALTLSNAGDAGTARGDMACVVGGAFPVLSALLGGLCILMTVVWPLRVWARPRVAAAVAGVLRSAAAAAAAASVSPPPADAHVTAVLLCAARGAWVAPLVAACACSEPAEGQMHGVSESSAVGGGLSKVGSGDGAAAAAAAVPTPNSLRLLACDAWGSPAFPGTSAWLRVNAAAELATAVPPADAARAEVRVGHADFRPALALRPCARLLLPVGSSALVFAPFLWGTSSEAPPGESPADGAARVRATLAEARRVLAPAGVGRLVTLTPFFRAKAATEGLKSAGFMHVRTLPGLHWLTFFPSRLIEAATPDEDVGVGGDGGQGGGWDRCSRLTNPPDEEEGTALSGSAASGGDVSRARAVRLAVYAVAFAAGAALVAVLVGLLQVHWAFLNASVMGPAPGLPAGYRMGAMSLALQLNIPVALALLLDGAWVAAETASRVGGGSGGGGEPHAAHCDASHPDAPLLAVASSGAAASLLPHKSGAHAGGMRGAAHDCAVAARCVVMAVVGSVAMTCVTWLPPFVVDMVWLAVSPPPSSDSMHGVNQAVAAVLPFFLVQVLRAQASKLGARAEEGEREESREDAQTEA